MYRWGCYKGRSVRVVQGAVENRQPKDKALIVSVHHAPFSADDDIVVVILF